MSKYNQNYNQYDGKDANYDPNDPCRCADFCGCLAVCLFVGTGFGLGVVVYVRLSGGMCFATGCGLHIILLGATRMARGFGGFDRVLGTGAVRGAPCRFLHHLIHFGIGSGRVRGLERCLRVRLR